MAKAECRSGSTVSLHVCGHVGSLSLSLGTEVRQAAFHYTAKPFKTISWCWNGIWPAKWYTNLKRDFPSLSLAFNHSTCCVLLGLNNSSRHTRPSWFSRNQDSSQDLSTNNIQSHRVLSLRVLLVWPYFDWLRHREMKSSLIQPKNLILTNSDLSMHS